MSYDLRKTAPFIHTDRTTKYMYFCLLIALIPPVTYAVFYYGIKAAVLIAFCGFLASFCQGFKDYSAPVHGVVLALMLPSTGSLYTAAIGVLISEFMLKKMFGGPGSNIVYPAACSRMILELMFPQDMAVALEPGQNWFSLKTLFVLGGEDKTPLTAITYSKAEIIAGRFPSYMGMGCFILIMVGMVFLCHSKATKMGAPVAYLITVFLIKMLITTEGNFFMSSLSFMMTSGVAFAAIYMLTDPTNTVQFGYAAPVEGIVCGVATALLSMRVTGITLVLVPVLLAGLMDGSIRFYVGLLEKKRLEVEQNEEI